MGAKVGSFCPGEKPSCAPWGASLYEISLTGGGEKL